VKQCGMSARSPCISGVSKHARPVLWRPDVSLAVDGIGAVCVSDLRSMQTPGEPVASGSPPVKRPESLSPSGPAQHKHVHVVTGHAQAFPVPLHAPSAVAHVVHARSHAPSSHLFPSSSGPASFSSRIHASVAFLNPSPLHCILQCHPLSESLSLRRKRPEPVAWLWREHVTHVFACPCVRGRFTEVVIRIRFDPHA